MNKPKPKILSKILSNR